MLISDLYTLDDHYRGVTTSNLVYDGGLYFGVYNNNNNNAPDSFPPGTSIIYVTPTVQNIWVSVHVCPIYIYDPVFRL